jgi:hypothetical protein
LFTAIFPSKVINWRRKDRLASIASGAYTWRIAHGIGIGEFRSEINKYFRTTYILLVNV